MENKLANSLLLGAMAGLLSATVATTPAIADTGKYSSIKQGTALQSDATVALFGWGKKDKAKDKDACSGKDGCGSKTTHKDACSGKDGCSSKDKDACSGKDGCSSKDKDACSGKDSCSGKTKESCKVKDACSNQAK
ncbi:MAG: hypothetical protein O3A01_05040 [bacterium]|nr:hypothetical protein [bacterium]